MIIDNKTKGVLGLLVRENNLPDLKSKVPADLAGKVASVKRVILDPGINDVDDTAWEAAKIVSAKRLRKKGTSLVYLGTPIKKGKSLTFDNVTPVPFSKIKPVMCERLAKDCYHLPTLEKWLEGELRESVRVVLHNRINKVKTIFGDEDDKNKQHVDTDVTDYTTFGNFISVEEDK